MSARSFVGPTNVIRAYQVLNKSSVSRSCYRTLGNRGLEGINGEHMFMYIPPDSDAAAKLVSYQIVLL
jgi:hypothetical protein